MLLHLYETIEAIRRSLSACRASVEQAMCVFFCFFCRRICERAALPPLNAIRQVKCCRCATTNNYDSRLLWASSVSDLTRKPAGGNGEGSLTACVVAVIGDCGNNWSQCEKRIKGCCTSTISCCNLRSWKNNVRHRCVWHCKNARQRTEMVVEGFY